MTQIQTILRSAVPALVMASMFAAAPARADDQNKRAMADFGTCSKPVYPADAIKQARTGKVTLGFLVAADGSIVEAKVKESSGHEDLDIAARDAIKLCKFHPAVKDGTPVQSWMQMQYVWTLK
jgi:bla regulator protein BlaR1